MKYTFKKNKNHNINDLMKKSGYIFHCTTEGVLCYHRYLDTHKFPRFHVYIKEVADQIEINMHFDQRNLNKKSNHNEPWAYVGNRINTEMKQLIDSIKNNDPLKKVNCPVQYSIQKKKSNKPKQNLFDLFF